MVLSKRRATCKFQTRSQTQIRIKFSNTNLGILVSNTNLSSPPPSQSQAPLEWSSCPTSRNLMGYNYWAIVLISKHLNFCYLFPSLPPPAVERGGVSGSMGMVILSCQTKIKKVHTVCFFVIIKHCHFKSFQISLLALASCGKGWYLRFHGNVRLVLPKSYFRRIISNLNCPCPDQLWKGLASQVPWKLPLRPAKRI